MPILNYTTTIDVSKTMGEIQAALARRGVTRISTPLRRQRHRSRPGLHTEDRLRHPRLRHPRGRPDPRPLLATVLDVLQWAAAQPSDPEHES